MELRHAMARFNNAAAALALVLACLIPSAWSATYTELSAIKQEAGWNTFLDKVKVAAVIKATAIIDQASPTAEAKAWAQDALRNPGSSADSIVWYVIGSNSGASVSAIVGASDSAVQTNVGAAVDALYGAGS